ncbi:MAG: AAA family ATPase [Bacteroidales bacterium]|jgi:hypothetical protein|nr:AAA family ATPase [Bacteroidales bacterium]
METTLFKRLPSGNSDFRDIITQNYAYVDKTRFIKELENESNRNHFLPEIKYEWLFEIKYCMTNATNAEITAKRNKELTQLTEYFHAYRVKDRPNLKAVLLLFIGKDKFEITKL